MKYLGIDFGKTRIGIAKSDNGIIATPVGYILNKGDKKNLTQIKQIIPPLGELTVVIGLPLHPDGNEMDICGEIRRFGEVISNELGAIIIYQDERYSSVDAEEYIRQNLGISKPEKIKELIDGVAAYMILQEYIKEKK